MAVSSWRAAGVICGPWGDSGLELLVGGEFEFDEPPPRTDSTTSSTRLDSNCSFTLTRIKQRGMNLARILIQKKSSSTKNKRKNLRKM